MNLKSLLIAVLVLLFGVVVKAESSADNKEMTHGSGGFIQMDIFTDGDIIDGEDITADGDDEEDMVEEDMEDMEGDMEDMEASETDMEEDFSTRSQPNDVFE